VVSEAVEMYAATLKGLDPGDRKEPAILQLLHLFGQATHEEIGRLAVDQLVSPDTIPLLDASAAHGQCILWALLTRYGYESLRDSLRPAARDLVDVLPAVCMSYLRQYRLDVAGAMLRLLAYLKSDPRTLSEGLTFLAFQQRSSGCFGYLNPLSPDYLRLSVERDLRFHLPITMHALWTLGELSSPSAPLLASEWEG